MRPPRRAFTAMLTGLVALALASCSTGQQPESGLDSQDTPLTALFAEIYSLSSDMSEEQQAAERQRQLGIEEAIAQCMADQGFEYIPYVAPLQSRAPVAEEALDPIEQAQQYGYQPPDTAEPEEYDPTANPNAELFAALPDAEKQAFVTAIQGDEAQRNPEEPYDWKNAGCTGAANQAAAQETDRRLAVYEAPEWAELRAQMDQLFEDIRQSPEMADLNRQWADCMAAEGLTAYTTPTEALTHFVGAAEGENAEPSEEEITAAVADAQCQQKIDYRDSALRLQITAEKQFIADNQTAIDGLLAALQEVSG